MKTAMRKMNGQNGKTFGRKMGRIVAALLCGTLLNAGAAHAAGALDGICGGQSVFGHVSGTGIDAGAVYGLVVNENAGTERVPDSGTGIDAGAVFGLVANENAGTEWVPDGFYDGLQLDFQTDEEMAASMKEKEKNINPVWDPQRLNQSFPSRVIRDVSGICAKWHGEPMFVLGLVPTSGSNLRSTPSLSGNGNIVHTLHGNETICIYFSVYSGGREWYYVVSEKGYEGFAAASRIMLFD